MADVIPANVIAAYAATAAKAAPVAGAAGAEAAAAATPPGRTDFATMVTDALGSMRDATATAETQATAAIQGDTPLHDVVAAVSNAEMTLQTVVAVRDRVIAAYQDIIRMPI